MEAEETFRRWGDGGRACSSFPGRVVKALMGKSLLARSDFESDLSFGLIKLRVLGSVPFLLVFEGRHDVPEWCNENEWELFPRLSAALYIFLYISALSAGGDERCDISLPLFSLVEILFSGATTAVGGRSSAVCRLYDSSHTHKLTLYYLYSTSSTANETVVKIHYQIYFLPFSRHADRSD